MNFDYQKLQIADRLVRTKDNILYKHHTVYAAFHKNQHIVAENQIKVSLLYFIKPIYKRRHLKKGRL